MKCLVTTLQESVSDNSLLKLGELVVSFRGRTTGVTPLELMGGGAYTLRGDVYRTDSSGMSNYGNSWSGSGTYYVSHGEFEIVFSNKYSLYNFSSGGSGVRGSLADYAYCSNLNMLHLEGSYLKGDLKDIEYIINIGHLGVGDTKVTGNLSSLSGMTKLKYLGIQRDNITGNLSSLANTILTSLYIDGANGITGDIASLPSSLLTLSVSRASNISGTLSALAAKCPSLKTLRVDNTNISGDTSDLASLAQLTTFTYANCPNITGTWPLV